MNKKTIFSTYLKDLTVVARQGDAREESFYSALEKMLEKVAHTTGRTHVHVTTLPRPTEGGNPDFRLWNGTDRIIGYIEAKKPTEERLDIIENSEQLKRYRENVSKSHPHQLPRVPAVPKWRARRDSSIWAALCAQRAGHNTSARKPR